MIRKWEINYYQRYQRYSQHRVSLPSFRKVFDIWMDMMAACGWREVCSDWGWLKILVVSMWRCLHPRNLVQANVISLLIGVFTWEAGMNWTAQTGFVPPHADLDVHTPIPASGLVRIRPPAAEWGYSCDEQQMQQGPAPGLCTRCKAGRWRRRQLPKYWRVHRPQGSGLSGHVSLGRALPAALLIPSGPGTGLDWLPADMSLLLPLINCPEGATLWDGRSAARCWPFPRPFPAEESPPQGRSGGRECQGNHLQPCPLLPMPQHFYVVPSGIYRGW